MGQLQLYGLTLGETERIKLQVHRLASQSASRSIHSCLRWQQTVDSLLPPASFLTRAVFVLVWVLVVRPEATSRNLRQTYQVQTLETGVNTRTHTHLEDENDNLTFPEQITPSANQLSRTQLQIYHTVTATFTSTKRRSLTIPCTCHESSTSTPPTRTKYCACNEK